MIRAPLRAALWHRVCKQERLLKRDSMEKSRNIILQQMFTLRECMFLVFREGVFGSSTSLHSKIFLHLKDSLSFPVSVYPICFASPPHAAPTDWLKTFGSDAFLLELVDRPATIQADWKKLEVWAFLSTLLHWKRTQSHSRGSKAESCTQEADCVHPCAEKVNHRHGPGIRGRFYEHTGLFTAQAEFRFQQIPLKNCSWIHLEANMCVCVCTQQKYESE